MHVFSDLLKPFTLKKPFILKFSMKQNIFFIFVFYFGFGGGINNAIMVQKGTIHNNWKETQALSFNYMVTYT